MTGPQPVQLDGQQVEALNALLALVHYDDLAIAWRNLLPRELGGQDNLAEQES